MRPRFWRLAVCALAAATGAVLVLAPAGTARAACFGPQQVLPQVLIDQFLANPGQVLQNYPDGGAVMISTLRDLVASSPATLAPVIALLANANPAQATAIGTASGLAAQTCVRTDQAYATQIQQALAATNNQTAILAMAAVLGDKPIGSIGGGGGGGSPGAGGGQINPIPSGLTGFSTSGLSQTFNPPGTRTTGTNYFTSSFSTGGTSTTTTTTPTTTPTRPVSSH
jgi:hypothetical protein